MYTADVLFNKPGGQLGVEDCEAIERLLSDWWKHGQIVCSDWSLAVRDGDCRVAVRIPERGALSPRRGNQWIKEARMKLRGLGLNPPEIRVLGSDPSENTLGRHKPSFLILYTHFLETGPPLRCGDTFGYVPLYWIPCTTEWETYEDMLRWQRVYACCDELFIQSGVGERFGTRELSHMDSALSRDGRELCGIIEKVSGIPTYYYLHRHYGRSLKQEKTRRCPGCEKAWLLKDPLFDLFDFRCERCRLLSNVAFDVRHRAGEAE